MQAHTIDDGIPVNPPFRAYCIRIYCNARVTLCHGLSQAVRARHLNMAVFPVIPYIDVPRVAAHLAILNQIALYVGLQINLHGFAAVGTGDNKLVWD